jgi:hypothetical protein
MTGSQVPGSGVRQRSSRVWAVSPGAAYLFAWSRTYFVGVRGAKVPPRVRVVSPRLTAVATALLSIAAAAASAQSPPPGRVVPVWEPNGAVHALALDGQTLYVGGTFDHVGPLTGTFATVDAANDKAFTTGAQLDAYVFAVVADGAGGWFARTFESGGSFQSLSTTVEHLLPTGEKDPRWTRPTFASATGAFHIVLEGGRLFVAGAFTAVNGTPRMGLAALDPATGALLPWNADLAWVSQPPGGLFFVRWLAASPGRLYLSGNFDRVGAVPRNKFAVVDSATGAVLPPVLPTPVSDPVVDTIEVSGNRVYVRGGCRTGDAVICAYDLDLEPLPSWTFPTADVPMAATSTALFASYRTGGFPVSTRTVRLDPETGIELPWTDIVTTRGGPASTLTVAGNRLYVGGDFTALNGLPRHRLAAVDATTGALDNWAPLVGGHVLTLAVSGSTVALGGSFTSVGGINKQNLVAIDLTSGKVATANPPDVPTTVTTLLKVGDAMVVGSAVQPFGPPRTGPDLIAFSTRTGAPLPWSLASDGRINAIAADAQRLYVAGRFSTLSGTARQNVAAVELQTGALTAWNPSPNGEVTALAVSNGTLFAGGRFSVVPGYGRAGGVAWDPASGAVLSFNPNLGPGVTPKAFAVYQNRVLLVLDRDSGALDSFEWVDRVTGMPVPPATDADIYAKSAAQVGDTVFAVSRLTAFPNVVAVVNAPTGAVQVRAVGSLGDGLSIAASAGSSRLAAARWARRPEQGT